MANSKDEYTRKLEETLRKFLEPIKSIPFPIVIEALTSHKVLKFDYKKDKYILDLFVKAASMAGQKAAEKGIVADRPNEAGNRIEPYISKALNQAGINAQTPQTSTGKKRGVGYPDIELHHNKGWNGYLDCKTFAAKSKDSSFRAFYLSPSQEPKIIRNAVHLVLSYELEFTNGVYVPRSWHLYDLHGLTVQVKHEFNASNKELYARQLLLAEDQIK